MEDAAAPVEGKLQTLERQILELTEHLDYLEIRRRRKNIRIVGLQVNVEGDHPLKFLKSWLPSSLGFQTKSDYMKIERAHHNPDSISVSKGC